MGTINYTTSKYITLGLKPYNIEDIRADYMEDYSDDILYEIKSDIEDDDRKEVEKELENHSFNWWKVEVIPGYYEGFSIRITDNFDLWLYASEKKEANKEVTEIKKLLCLLVDDFNLVSCCPFWCTTYHSPKESKQYIREAIKEMRKD